MDLKKIASTLLSSDSISELSNVTGSSKSDVKKVLSSAIPALLNGANSQANDKNTTESFTKALSDHAKDDTSNLASFLGNVDLADGAKIVTHLLGSGKSDVTKSVSKETGVSSKNTNQILSAVAPLLMSLLGKQADEDDDKESGVGALFSSLLDNVDIGDIIGGLTSTNTSTGTAKKKKKKTGKKESSNSGIGSIVSGLLGKLLK
ncbi:MAG: DUF937 domain-containing protein [Lachnospira sp.]|nr:DUF937 domain-containing protein [Lachnospira sp.]